MADIAKLVEDLSQLTVMEAAELAKALEEAWGVSAAAAVAVAAPAGGGAAAEAVEEKTDDEHRGQRDQEDHGFLSPPQHQMTGAGHQPRHHTHERGRHSASLPQVFCGDRRHEHAAGETQRPRQYRARGVRSIPYAGDAAQK